MISQSGAFSNFIFGGEKIVLKLTYELKTQTHRFTIYRQYYQHLIQTGRHDNQHNDTQNNDTHQKGIICDIHHRDNRLNNTLPLC